MINKSNDENKLSFDNVQDGFDRTFNSARDTNTSKPLMAAVGKHARRVSSRYSQSCTEEAEECDY